jgi:hypothetical protein
LTNVSQHGLWLLVDGRDRHLPYDQFLWFRHGTVAQLSAIERPTHEHLRWPDLDVDLTLESIDQPGDFPLVSRES